MLLSYITSKRLCTSTVPARTEYHNFNALSGHMTGSHTVYHEEFSMGYICS